MQTSSRAKIDQIVSAATWARYPSLHVALQRWADLSGEESADLVVSAIPIEGGCVSVRISRTEGEGHPMDWAEWIALPEFLTADQSAVDHLAMRESHRLALKLMMRTGTGLRPRLPDMPAAREPAAEATATNGHASNTNGKGRKNMAKTKPAATSGRRAATTAAPRAEMRGAATAPARPATKTTKPAAKTTPATKTTRAATKPAAAPAGSTKVVRATKPAAPAKTKPAAAKTPAKPGPGKSRSR